MELNIKKRFNSIHNRLQQHSKITLFGILLPLVMLPIMGLVTGSVSAVIIPTLITSIVCCSTFKATTMLPSLVSKMNHFLFGKKQLKPTSKSIDIQIEQTQKFQDLNAEIVALKDELAKINSSHTQLSNKNKTLNDKIQEQAAELMSAMGRESDLLEKSTNLITEIRQLNTALQTEISKNTALTDENRSLKNDNIHLIVDNKTLTKNSHAQQAVNNSLLERLNKIKTLGTEHNESINALGSQSGRPQAILNAFTPSLTTEQLTQNAVTTQTSKKRTPLYPKLP